LPRTWYFWTNNHLSGHGCIRCRDDKHSIKITSNLTIFLSKADKKHNKKYNYSEVIYKGSQSKVKIICEEHGVFEQTPAKHLFGNGCVKCSSPLNCLSFEDFKKLANDKHNHRYTYGDDYKNPSSKTPIICEKHGVFMQTAGSHIRGRGCPKCADIIRTNKNVETYRGKPTILYYVKVDDLFKIGVCVINKGYKDIDTNILKGRYSKDIHKYNIEILRTKIFQDGSEAYILEQRILEEFSMYRYLGVDMKGFGGYTELFYKDIIHPD